MRLLPGVQERLDQVPALAKRAVRLFAPRVDLPRASQETRRVENAEKARGLLEDLRSVSLAAIALDSEFRFDSPEVPLCSGGVWQDVHSVRPICVSVAAWAMPDFEAGEDEGGGGEVSGYVIRAVLDVRVPEVVAHLGDILRLRVPFIFHHAKPELFVFWSLGLDPDLHQIYDTYLAAACLSLGLHHRRGRKEGAGQSEAEQIRSNDDLKRERAHHLSLVGQCAHYRLAYPHSESKDELRHAFLGLGSGDPLDGRMVAYAADDAEWTLRLYLAQQADVLRNGLATHLNTVEFPFAAANARMEWRGLHVDAERRRMVLAAARKAAEHHADVLRSHGIDPPGSRERFLAVMLRAGLADHFMRRGKPCTEDDLLETVEDAHPAIGSFRHHRRYRRLAGEEWLTGALTGADGRTHPRHCQLGAATGRNSCSTPNIAGIGRVLRPVVTAPLCRALVELDYGQIEVGVAAAESGDRDLVAAYNSGDVYAAMAQRFYAERLTEKERALRPADFKSRRPDLRDAMKTFVLAVIYNIQAPALAARFGIGLEEAEMERRRFLALFPVLDAWLQAATAFGAARGHASVISGLRRLMKRRGKVDTWTRNFLRNTPIQGGATVVFKRAVVDLDRAFRGTSTGPRKR